MPSRPRFLLRAQHVSSFRRRLQRVARSPAVDASQHSAGSALETRRQSTCRDGVSVVSSHSVAAADFPEAPRPGATARRDPAARRCRHIRAAHTHSLPRPSATGAAPTRSSPSRRRSRPVARPDPRAAAAASAGQCIPATRPTPRRRAASRAAAAVQLRIRSMTRAMESDEGVCLCNR